MDGSILLSAPDNIECEVKLEYFCLQQTSKQISH